MYGRDLIAIPEVLADNGFATDKLGRLINEAANVQNAHFTGNVWSGAFAAINQINNTIAAIGSGAISPITTADNDRWLGQLYFLRGLYYFDLVKVYGYIPGAVVSVQDRGGVPLSTSGIATSSDALAWKPFTMESRNSYRNFVSSALYYTSREYWCK